jgi:uncharacterized protein YbjT (DUF2867 family)
MIIVTGANGKLGRGVVESLLNRFPAHDVGVCVRDPHVARPLADRGVRVRRGDFTDPGSLAHAFEGADRVLVVSVDTTGPDAVAMHRTAIRAARDAGAARIVYTSHAGARPSSAFAPMSDHAAAEEDLRGSGVPFTSLRNGFYASTAVMLLQSALATGELAVPEDGPVAWTTHSDLAEAAAVALHDDVPHGGVLDGPTPALTACEALDMAEVAALASYVTGRTIRHVVVPPDDYRARLIAHGAPEHAAELLVGMFAAAREGDFATMGPTLADLLGRAPRTLRDALASATSTSSHPSGLSA